MDFCSFSFFFFFFLSTTYVSDVAHNKKKAYYAFHTFFFVKCICVNLTREVAVQFPTEKYYFVKVVMLYHVQVN